VVFERRFGSYGKLRIGIVGCRMVSGACFETLEQFADLDVMACASRSRVRAEERAAEFGVRCVLEPEELWNHR
jgi:predicted dehydrogenase